LAGAALVCAIAVCRPTKAIKNRAACAHINWTLGLFVM
jgi:hypothetical protein